MRQLVFSIGIIILSIFVINASAAAQEISRMDYEKNEKGYWLNLGFGTNYFGPTLKADKYLYIRHSVRVTIQNRVY